MLLRATVIAATFLATPMPALATDAEALPSELAGIVELRIGKGDKWVLATSPPLPFTPQTMIREAIGDDVSLFHPAKFMSEPETIVAALTKLQQIAPVHGAELWGLASELNNPGISQAMMQRVQVVAQPSKGLGNIDLSSAEQLQIPILFSPKATGGATFRMALTLGMNAMQLIQWPAPDGRPSASPEERLLAVVLREMRNQPYGEQLIRTGTWPGWRMDQGPELGIDLDAQIRLATFGGDEKTRERFARLARMLGAEVVHAKGVDKQLIDGADVVVSLTDHAAKQVKAQAAVTSGKQLTNASSALTKQAAEHFPGRSLYGATIGIAAGTGDIGSRVGAFLQAAFNANILYSTRNEWLLRGDPRAFSLDALVEQPMHVLSLHLPYTPDQKQLFEYLDAARLGRIRTPEGEGAVIWNSARGELIDERALRSALLLGQQDARAGGCALAAGLDVYHGENVPAQCAKPFRDLRNVSLGSHQGSATKTAPRFVASTDPAEHGARVQMKLDQYKLGLFASGRRPNNIYVYPKRGTK